MKLLRTDEVPIDAIEIGARLRQVDDAWVDALADLIEEKGFTDPVDVAVESANTYFLLDGAHRIAACEQIGRTTILASVFEADDDECRLAEIDAQLFHRDLSALDRAVFLAARKDVYEAMHPRSKRGGDRGNQHTGGRHSDTMSFSQSTAARLEMSPSTVERAIRIAKNIPDDVRRQIAFTPLADDQSGLLLLAGTDPETQRAAVSRLAQRESPNLKSAIAAIAGTAAPQPSKDDKDLATLTDTWARASAAVRTAFLAQLREEMGEG